MPTSTPVVSADGPGRETIGATRPRDADTTRRSLLKAARRRFALDGYAATTVRDIAADAGVNVSLINRYFESKEGLFEACLTRAAADLDRPASATLDELAARMAAQVVTSIDDDDSLLLLLLLRSSGDEQADRIRSATIQSFASGIAGVVRGSAEGPDDDLILRAQLAICTALGVALLRSSTGLELEPLSTATAEELAAPLRDVFTALLERQPSA